jgi:outer membrane protein assembly factor BamB
MHRLAVALLCGGFLLGPMARGEDWPQFRGPSGTAVADGHPLPARIGPDRNVVWKVPLPPGHSSPVVFGDRIYLTAVRGPALLTIALDAAEGKVLWEAEAPHEKREKIHGIGSHAQPTPATDGTRVVSFFGSSGLLCYDKSGKRLWYLKIGPFKNEFGAASSPLIVGDTVILGGDHDQDSFLLAVDKHTGQTRWRVDRSAFPCSFSSPAVWEVAGRKQVVVAGTLRVVGYDFETGKELWTVRGMARVMNQTPTAGPDGTLYVSGWAAGGDAGDRFDLLPFDDMIKQHDTNKNGTLEESEVPDGPLKPRFPQIDRDKDGRITKAEYEDMRRIFDTAHNRLVAIKPGARGEATDTHVLWSVEKDLPLISSLLCYKGLLFLPKDGGLLTAVDARTGKAAKQERVVVGATWYSSPVGGDGKVYLVSQRGDLAVVSAEPQWKVLSRARFGEDVYATPAIAGGRIYLRTTGHLYCFADKP